MWVRRGVLNCAVLAVQFQFTHPCGCDYVRSNSIRVFRVSIHAPVWVRLLPTGEIATLVKFQVTHPCGCDSQTTEHSDRQISFNSRTRVGATSSSVSEVSGFQVSIHAPVWVRRANSNSLSSIRSFNSRTRVGATILVPQDKGASPVSIHAPVWVRQPDDGALRQANKFQFTHPCGCDMRRKRVKPAYPSFNSRTRVGATFRGIL